MSKHTPGPWRVANGVQIRSQRDQIAKVWMMRNGEGNANARLIALAPELLEVLTELANSLPSAEYMRQQGQEEGPLLRKMRAVIAKATGENK